MPEKRQLKNHGQLLWGVALLVMGVAVFFRTHQVIPKLQEMNHASATLVFIRICFYLIGIILVGGGIKKILRHFAHPAASRVQEGADEHTDRTDR